jgi:BirA family biotin operon repressor/biotin-[acetyl-CoA-carboxylase] ligase
VIYLDSVDSTNTEAKKLLIQGEGEGVIVTAGRQTAGRGRKGRTWLSPAGGLYFSLILHPRLEVESGPLLGLLGACAVARSLSKLGVVGVSVKWPNDVLVKQCKIAGILCETVFLGSDSLGTVVGIGVNQNCPVSKMPQGLQWPTTSIIDEIGKPTSIESLLCSIVNEIDDLLQNVEERRSFSEVLDEWRKLSSTIGSKVRVHEDGKTIDGIVKNIDSNGALIVQTKNGLVSVLQGDVSHLRVED